MRRVRRVFCQIGVVAAALVGIVGCQDKLTHDRFSRIRQNVSSQREVAVLLGEPNDKLGDRWYYERPDRHLNVLVDFDDKGQVSRKQWIDAKSAVWEDSNESGG